MQELKYAITTANDMKALYRDSEDFHICRYILGIPSELENSYIN